MATPEALPESRSSIDPVTQAIFNFRQTLYVERGQSAEELIARYWAVNAEYIASMPLEASRSTQEEYVVGVITRLAELADEVIKFAPNLGLDPYIVKWFSAHLASYQIIISQMSSEQPSMSISALSRSKPLPPADEMSQPKEIKPQEPRRRPGRPKKSKVVQAEPQATEPEPTEPTEPPAPPAAEETPPPAAES